jgi:fumarate reductase subunit C
VTTPMRSRDVTDVPAGADGSAAPAARPLRSYPYRQPFNWWLRQRGYVLYMLRELTAVPIAAWWVLFLVELARMRGGAAGYRPFEGPAFAIVGILCLAAAVWHAYTFLSFAGLVMRIPLGDRYVAPRTIAGGAFGAFVVLTAVIAGLLIWGGS